MKNLTAPPWKEYEILDSGNGKKLERFGTVTLIRPEGAALWKPALPEREWQNRADGEFIETKPGEGKWRTRESFPEEWYLTYPLDDKSLSFRLRQTRFKHVGVFPEQTVNWNHLYQNCHKDEKVLNLFAHTGGASLAAALAGAEVTHVDSVYSMVGWAKENGKKTDVENIRWICEDSMTFVEKEIKRGRSYKRIIMDPPSYGFSKKGGQWKIERDLEPLLKKSALLAEKGEITLNCYSKRMEENRLTPLLKKLFPASRISMEKLVLPDGQGREINCGYLVRIDLS
ncbi:MAG: class I SAM-dependent methyltransferase [Spirochaetales bacterium]|nr:class I SAM-dependent methyltransferase [Spirochaetales bacterium]